MTKRPEWLNNLSTEVDFEVEAKVDFSYLPCFHGSYEEPSEDPEHKITEITLYILVPIIKDKSTGKVEWGKVSLGKPTPEQFAILTSFEVICDACDLEGLKNVGD